MQDPLTEHQVEAFRRDGFVIVEEGFLGERALELVRERFAALFAGEHATVETADTVLGALDAVLAQGRHRAGRRLG
ncbi:MAG: hypothetical protein ACRDL0_14870 [Thermoleophilaceae bacterium]